MGFLERLGRGWGIVLQSFRIVKADKEILVYPILQGIIILGLGALILLPLIFNATPGENPGFLLGVIIFTAISYLVSAFFQAAIVSSASIRFSGKNPSLKDGFIQPLKRFFALFTWAIVSFFVALLIGARRGKQQEGNAQFESQAVASVAELTWSLITFYVIPVMLFEKLSVFKAIGRSSSLFKKTWGENVAARFTIHTLIGLIMLPFILLLIWAVYVKSISFIIISGALFGISLLIACVLQVVTDGILRAALYHYAIKGKVPSVLGIQAKDLFG
jgi:hypothetical protein